MTDAPMVQIEDETPERHANLAAKASARTLAETLAALANFNGGAVALGVNSKGIVERENDIAGLRDLALRACLLCDPPLLLPNPVEKGEARSRYLAIEVPPGLPHVYNVQGVYPTRMGAHNRPLTTAELRRLLLDRAESSVEESVIDIATLADFDPRALSRWLDRLMALPPAGEVRMDDPIVTDALLARGCVVRGAEGALKPTLAGLLVLGRDPQRFARHAEVLCVRYPGEAMGDEFIRQEIGGALPEQIRLAEAFVASNMQRTTRIRGLAREEVGDYPLAVVREAIVNAVAHRDYAMRGEGVRVLLFSNRLEVYSPGRLPGHVTLANLKEERYSRNEAIVALLGDLGYIERLGYGIDRMYLLLQEGGMPEPAFVETAAGFQVTLRAATQTPLEPEVAPNSSASTLPPVAAPAGGSPASDQAARERAQGLNERQITALAFVREQGKITNSELQEMTPDVSAETIRRDLADLVERNLLLRIGSKRATYYILK